MNLMEYGFKYGESETLRSLCRVRFKDDGLFKTAEAYLCHEFGIWSKAEVIANSEKFYKCKLHPYVQMYVEPDLLNNFNKSLYLPYSIDKTLKTATLFTLPEVASTKTAFPDCLKGFDITVYETDIVTFIENMFDLFGKPDFLFELPIKDVLEFIIKESTKEGVIDTTISSGNFNIGQVYHNINLDTEYSKIKISNFQIQELVSYISCLAGNPVDSANLFSKRISVAFSEKYRSRIEMTPNYYGYMITMRILGNEDFSMTLEGINLSPKTIAFIRRYNQNMNKRGARVMAGPTGSGKNTTIFSDIREILDVWKIKAVSIEQPVELIMEGMEQLSGNTDEQFANYAQALIRHNPGLVYFSEITDRTAVEFLKIANTGKVVYATVHTNSAATILSRIADLTGAPMDRVIQDIEVCMYQTLERDERYGVVPKNTCIYFSDRIRYECIGKTSGEIMKILKREEDRWESLTTEDIEGGILD